MAYHSFDTDVAEKVGVNAAVIYQNIVWWCKTNQANGRNERDGRFWTYNSIKALSELFPYLSAKQIRTALDKLEETGLILSGCFNEKGYDRTKWYCPSGQVDLPKKEAPFAQEGEPIPDSKPDNKPDTNISSSDDDDDMEFFERVFWSRYPKKVGKKAAFKTFKRLMKEVDRGKVHYGKFMSGLDRYLKLVDGKELQYIKNPATWLNGEHWKDGE